MKTLTALISRVLFENQHYIACVTSAGLTVQRKRSGRGLCLPACNARFNEWIEAFETSDTEESSALCRGFLGSFV